MAGNAGTKRRRGRPTKYRPALVPVVEALAAKGLTDAEISRKMGISRSTLLAWAEEHEDFSRALSRGKAEADDAVERSLRERAVGFTQTEREIIETYQQAEEQLPGASETDAPDDPRARAALEALQEHIFAEGTPAPKRPRSPRKTGESLVVVARTVRVRKKRIAGDVGAAKLWLVNRRPDKWREKQVIEHQGEVQAKVDLSTFTPEQLVAMAERAIELRGKA